MPKKIKPAKRPSEKLVASARDYVLNAFDTAAVLLTEHECLGLIAGLREDLALRQYAIEWHGFEAAQNRKPASRKVAA